MTKNRSFWSAVMDEVEVNPKRIRDFGRVMLIVPGFLVPFFLMWRNDWTPGTVSIVFFSLGLIIFLVSLVRPNALHRVYKVWMGLAIVLGLFMTKVIISLIFFLMMTPIGIGRRILVKDPLGLKQDKSAASYWQQKENPNPAPSSYEKQY